MVHLGNMTYSPCRFTIIKYNVGKEIKEIKLRTMLRTYHDIQQQIWKDSKICWSLFLRSTSLITTRTWDKKLGELEGTRYPLRSISAGDLPSQEAMERKTPIKMPQRKCILNNITMYWKTLCLSKEMSNGECSSISVRITAIDCGKNVIKQQETECRRISNKIC